MNGSHLFCFGLGYSALALAHQLAGEGWTITGTSPTGAAPDSGPSREDLVPVPDLTGRPVAVARVEQALIATVVAHAGDQVCSIDPYSSRPDPPAVRYGATMGFCDGWKLYLSCYGTTRSGQPRPDRPYHPASHI